MYFQISRDLVTISRLRDVAGGEMDLGIFCRIEPFVALCVLVLQSITRIDGCHVDRYVKFGGCRVLLVENDAAFKILEDSGGIIAGKCDGIPLCNLPVLGGKESKGAACQDQDSGDGIDYLVHIIGLSS